ncbi:hypothetical protein [Psychroflexus planctonicus]|uniref:DUF3887 domain-containing protein n=1 Tax=Psychroflexus planctonicus TaxID=1526575 RepID=A0ABQ1SJL8_9FLAO|nr:hypothetical protein [Psychroflexus planctonicus]GGE39949.1 hypothetical protein GCM10010832_20180 [Psychroflexus planctonicus]
MDTFKYTIILFFIGLSSLFAQEKIGEANVENFEKFVTDVYLDATQDAIKSNQKSIDFYKGILERLAFYEASSFPEELTLTNMSSVYKIKQYNPNLDFNLPEDYKEFNPYKYKLNTYNTEAIYYYSESTNYIIGLLPISQ